MWVTYIICKLFLIEKLLLIVVVVKIPLEFTTAAWWSLTFSLSLVIRSTRNANMKVLFTVITGMLLSLFLSC